jgi:alkylation response protein AidB-like acyl-CoA dehydrogenase
MTTGTNTRLAEAARDLYEPIRRAAPSGDDLRRLPSETVAAISAAGLFRMWLPDTLGGPAADPLDTLHAVEEISRADGSAGWSLMIGAESNGIVAAHLPLAGAREIFPPDTEVITGGSVSPGAGQAVEVDGGYQISGRWRFGSGCQHCDWMYGNCDILDGDAIRTRANGTPEMLIVVLPKSDFEIIDTWNVVGLRGTGSHDYAAEDVFVPSAHTFSIFDGPVDTSVPFLSLPFISFLALTKAPISTGIALGAIDELVALAATKTATGGTAPLRETPRVQRAVADATTMVHAARAFFDRALEDVLRVIAAGDSPGLHERAMLRLAAANATSRSARAVELVYTAAGTSSIKSGQPLERAFRDIHTLTQHVNASESVVEPAGRVLLDLDPEWPLF